MNILTNIEAWRACDLKGQTIGFVPTMGHLHEGHVALVREAMQQNDQVVVSIFVNPTQFNDRVDYEKYPISDASDIALLESLGAHYLFMPTYEELYHDEFTIQVIETEESLLMEGANRPGHFSGMLTIVLKLFHIIRPMRAYFGEKDFQQLCLVRKMIKALFLPIEIVQVATVRAASGLALSSRNSRLSEESRQKASLLYQALHMNEPLSVIHAWLEQQGFEVDYVVLQFGRRLVAARLDGVRLIDNIAWVCDENRGK